MGSPVANNPLDNIDLSQPEANRDEQDHNSDDQSSTELQLETLRNEKATLEAQYGALLAKLTTMRTTLGDKLRQDAVSPLITHTTIQSVFDWNGLIHSSLCTSCRMSWTEENNRSVNYKPRTKTSS
jgi:hypothetical protein